MSDKTSLGDRMKDIESVSRTRLTKKIPVIARFDGKAFHTLTKGMPKPYCKDFQYTMLDTALFLCQQIQGAKLAYVQSDEISVLIMDNTARDTQAWFNYEVQKMCSVGASLATSQFVYSYIRNFGAKVIGNGVRPAFDSRFFNLPENEVCNYFIWRQQDATRNSIQGLAQANFSHKECHGLSCDKLQDKLFVEKGINWNDCLPMDKRGACVRKVDKKVSVHVNNATAQFVTRNTWDVDYDTPVFTQNRDYIDRWLKASDVQRG